MNSFIKEISIKNIAVNLVGTLSAKVLQKVIMNAVETAKIDDEEYLKYCLG